MIAIIATLKVQDGKQAQFEALFVKLAAQVRAEEPGNLTYQLTRSRTEPGVYKVMELYVDEEAIGRHKASAHFKAAGPELAPCLAGAPVLEFLDAVD